MMLQRIKTILTGNKGAEGPPARLEGKPVALHGGGLTAAQGRVYAVGDVHGRDDLLVMLLKTIEVDGLDYKGPKTIVMLGDLINRGPASKAVLARVQHSLPQGWQQAVLRGNHEQALLDYLAKPETEHAWLGWGGVQTLESYGVAPYGPRGLREPAALAAELEAELLADGTLAWLKERPLYWVCGGYAFVHAGVRTGLPLAAQSAFDLLFIRDDWLGRPHGLPQRVVFGHTIMQEPLVLADRIGIDTGAYQSGVLTAVVLEGQTTRVLQAKL
jgi:serine/threonine protein phosphatase 1